MGYIVEVAVNNFWHSQVFKFVSFGSLYLSKIRIKA